jgi:hypothetical protein
LSPVFKTIADFRKDNGKAIRRVCREFVVLCWSLNLFSEAIVAIDGSKFKAVDNRDKNFTDHKLKARMQCRPLIWVIPRRRGRECYRRTWKRIGVTQVWYGQ